MTKKPIDILKDAMNIEENVSKIPQGSIAQKISDLVKEELIKIQDDQHKPVFDATQINAELAMAAALILAALTRGEDYETSFHVAADMMQSFDRCISGVLSFKQVTGD